ncbi:four helix bundle protein [Cognataquiflexum rubidum]|uniref:four helix bundle protein n=1 Tax=Cognataquiflexum rubidum TaxID=2922273 RepID=UPI001F1447E9|nr:four helix bundle protein [Cognataquiflexum rubidum]MCH6236744.1 four helix bundle protein [Cognataquiflexum rubidum]
MESFEQLEVWKKARKIRIFVMKVILKLPKEEKYGLFMQSKRSSRSISNNIAEGFGRFHFQENIQFCRVARGSLTETLDHMIIALDEGYISDEDLNNFRHLYSSCLKLINGYIAYLKKAKTGQDS